MTKSYSGGLLGLVGRTEEGRRKLIAWNNAAPMQNSPDRIDCDGRIICWAEYGLKTACGWEIDHAIPTALGGSDLYENIRARHWQGNSKAGGILGGLLSERPNAVGLLGKLTSGRP